MQDFYRLSSNRWSKIDQVLFGNSLPVERRGLGREGLGGRRPFFAGGGLRYRTFYDWPDRFATDSIEHKDKAMLGYLRKRFDVPAENCDIRQYWRGRWIVVPDIVMGSLEMPHALPGRGVETDNASPKQIVARTVATVVVAGWCAEWEIDVA